MSDLPPQPEPPAPPPPPPLPAGPKASWPPAKDTVGTGVLRLLLLHLIQIPLTVVAGPLWIGISQLVYVVPQHFAFKKQGRNACIRGLWIGAGVTFLLNAGCFGIVMYSLSSTSFH
ncbi:MAG: hypothetical protein IPL89_00390 [Acidobacteria bacterium]|nr:hypothetical protein [Acidobacteriota bacterium]